MSRLRSDTYIKPGSESSFDSDDLSTKRYNEPMLDAYCCISNVSVKKAVVLSGFLSTCQIVFNFCLILRGCGITMLDIGMAVLPVVTGTIAVSFLTFSIVHHSAISLRPYTVHHGLYLIASVIVFIVYLLLLFRQKDAIDFIIWLSESSSAAFFLANSSGSMRIAVGLLLIAQISINVFCLHISIGLYVVLDNAVRYVSADCTEVL